MTVFHKSHQISFEEEKLRILNELESVKDK